MCYWLYHTKDGNTQKNYSWQWEEFPENIHNIDGRKSFPLRTRLETYSVNRLKKNKPKNLSTPAELFFKQGACDGSSERKLGGVAVLLLGRSAAQKLTVKHQLERSEELTLLGFETSKQFWFKPTFGAWR